MSLQYDKIFQNFRSLYGKLTDCTFVLPQEDNTTYSGPIDELSILSGSREFVDTDFTENTFIVPGVIIDFASDMLKYEDRVMASELGQFDTELYSIHINNSLCLIGSGAFSGKYCYRLSNLVMFDGDPYLIISVKPSKLLNQVRIVVRKKN